MGKSCDTNRKESLSRLFHRQMISEMGDEELKRSAVVFAPHPDDETLGCGGTIIKKIQAGGRVDLVFVTDGSRSHARMVSPDRLKVMREQEALSAARVLGVDEDRVTFLRFRNGQLGVGGNEAVDRVKDILCRLQPQQVFVPSCLENIPDHRMTHKIVLAALRACDTQATVYEYPIWFWLHWPWVRLPWRHPRKSLGMLKDSLMAGFGLRMMMRFRSSVYVGNVLDRKRQALAEHKTQMVRMIPSACWPILSDVAEGQFLRCCFQDREFFCRRRIGNKRQEFGWPLACFPLI
jgi:LmbE family N-acetylglucosaminyl deacetylase